MPIDIGCYYDECVAPYIEGVPHKHMTKAQVTESEKSSAPQAAESEDAPVSGGGSGLKDALETIIREVEKRAAANAGYRLKPDQVKELWEFFLWSSMMQAALLEANEELGKRLKEEESKNRIPILRRKGR